MWEILIAGFIFLEVGVVQINKARELLSQPCSALTDSSILSRHPSDLHCFPSAISVISISCTLETSNCCLSFPLFQHYFSGLEDGSCPFCGCLPCIPGGTYQEGLRACFSCMPLKIITIKLLLSCEQ